MDFSRLKIDGCLCGNWNSTQFNLSKVLICRLWLLVGFLFFLLLSMKRQNNKIRFFASICAIKSKPSLDRMMWSVVVHSFWNGLTNSFAMNRCFVIASTKKEIVTHFCTNKTISSNWCHFTNEEIGTCFNFTWNDHMRWTINLTRPFLNKFFSLS